MEYSVHDLPLHEGSLITPKLGEPGCPNSHPSLSASRNQTVQFDQRPSFIARHRSPTLSALPKSDRTARFLSVFLRLTCVSCELLGGPVLFFIPPFVLSSMQLVSL